MSKPRLATKLRQNAEYPAITDFLDKIGFRHELHGPTGKGHPFLRIDLPDGRSIDHYINSTPKANGNPRAAMGKLRRALRDAGYDIGL
jgi:hypothetical protein